MQISSKYLVSFHLGWVFIVTMSWGGLGAENRPLVFHGKFFTYQGINLSEQDATLVNQMIDTTQMSYPIIQIVEKAHSCGSISIATLIGGDGKEYHNPCITLCAQQWRLLSDEKKLFILFHEAAHYMLGHCHEKDPAWVSYMVRKCGKEVFLYLGALFAGLTLGAIHPIIDIICTKNLKAAKFVFPLSALSTLCYGCYRNYMVHMQRHEYEADIAACQYLHSASGGIHYFCSHTEVPEKGVKGWLTQKLREMEHYVLIPFADYLKISTHPSDYARVAYMKEWQKEH